MPVGWWGRLVQSVWPKYGDAPISSERPAAGAEVAIEPIVVAAIDEGRVLLDQGEYARAMANFTLAASLAETSPEPQVALGDGCFAVKDYANAITRFDAAMRLAPNHVPALCRRGISRYYLKNYVGALDDLTRAQALDPAYPNIQTYVAMARKRIS